MRFPGLTRVAVRAVLGLAALSTWAPVMPGAGREGGPAPALPSDLRVWIGTPQSWAGLRGRVVLLDVWTFG